MCAAAGKTGAAAPGAATARRRPSGCRRCAPPRRAPAPTHHQKSSTVSKVYTARSVWPQVACFCLPLGLSNQSVHLVSSGCFWEKSGSPAGGGGGADEAEGHAGQAGCLGGRPGARAAADGLAMPAALAAGPRQALPAAHSPSCCGCCAAGSSPAMAAAATAAAARVVRCGGWAGGVAGSRCQIEQCKQRSGGRDEGAGLHAARHPNARAPCLAPALCIAHSHATALHAMRAGWTGRKEA